MIRLQQIWAVILSLLGLGTAFFIGSPAWAHEALNIGLSRFDAVAAENGVLLEWDVETEIDTAGYTIKRGENGTFEYLRGPKGNNKLFILAEGGPAQAYDYSIVDETAVKETRYTYQLIEITADNNETMQAEVSLTFHFEPTSTPITLSGDLGTPVSGTGQGSATTPTATQPPTATVQAPASSTNAPPPTVVAPTPLPSATTNAPTAAPVNNAPIPPTTAAGPNTAYPAASAVPQEVQSDAGESLPDVVDGGNQENVTGATMDAYPAPAESPANGSPGVVSALEPTTSEEQPVFEDGKTSPVVIGVSGSVTANTLRQLEAQQQITDEEPVNADSSRILLWVAFIVALIIFSASVVGAILLYSRRRPSK